MDTYTKLFSTITESTIWCEDSDTRVVWITMLAMCDKNGEVPASIPGLAKTAMVSLEKTELALEKFMQPDKYSRTKDFEGRRIEEIQGGWLLLNHATYRAKRQDEHRKDYRANWMREKRLSQREQKNEQSEPQCTNTDTDTDTDTKKTKEAPKSKEVAALGVDLGLWREYLKTRNKLKAPNTDRALNTLLNKITKLRDEGHNPGQLIEEANERGWKSVFAPQSNQQGAKNGKPTIAQIARNHATDESWAN